MSECSTFDFSTSMSRVATLYKKHFICTRTMTLFTYKQLRRNHSDLNRAELEKKKNSALESQTKYEPNIFIFM